MERGTVVLDLSSDHDGHADVRDRPRVAYDLR